MAGSSGRWQPKAAAASTFREMAPRLHTWPPASLPANNECEQTTVVVGAETKNERRARSPLPRWRAGPRQACDLIILGGAGYVAHFINRNGGCSDDRRVVQLVRHDTHPASKPRFWIRTAELVCARLSFGDGDPASHAGMVIS